jgi:hypothetical protein
VRDREVGPTLDDACITNSNERARLETFGFPDSDRAFPPGVKLYWKAED